MTFKQRTGDGLGGLTNDSCIGKLNIMHLNQWKQMNKWTKYTNCDDFFSLPLYQMHPAAAAAAAMSRCHTIDFLSISFLYSRTASAKSSPDSSRPYTSPSSANISNSGSSAGFSKYIFDEANRSAWSSLGLRLKPLSQRFARISRVFYSFW